MAVRHNAGDRARHIETRGNARHGGHPLTVPGPKVGSKVEMRINDAWGQDKTVERNDFFRGIEVTAHRGDLSILNPDIRYTVQMIHRVHNPGTFQNAVQHHSPHDKKVQRTGQP